MGYLNIFPSTWTNKNHSLIPINHKTQGIKSLPAWLNQALMYYLQEFHCEVFYAKLHNIGLWGVNILVSVKEVSRIISSREIVILSRGWYALVYIRVDSRISESGIYSFRWGIWVRYRIRWGVSSCVRVIFSVVWDIRVNWLWGWFFLLGLCFDYFTVGLQLCYGEASIILWWVSEIFESLWKNWSNWLLGLFVTTVKYRQYRVN